MKVPLYNKCVVLDTSTVFCTITFSSKSQELFKLKNHKRHLTKHSEKNGISKKKINK